MAVVLAGCANNSPEALRARSGNASNFQICRAIFLAPANVAQIARDEAERRSLDCAPYAAAVFQDKAQADAAASALAQQFLIQSQRPIQPMQPLPQDTRCISRWNGGTLVTDCH